MSDPARTVKVVIFSAHAFERDFLGEAARKAAITITFLEARLTAETAELARDYDCVCCSVSDELDVGTLSKLAELGVKLIALRSAGFNHVDLEAADRLGIPVVRVPAYSPHSVAEHAVALLLALVRRIPKAFNRVRDLNFSLEGLMGFDLNGKTIGIIGTGKIGSVMAKIMHGFGCRVLAFDPNPDAKLVANSTVEYVNLDRLYRESDVISLHLPLTPETHHLIGSDALMRMKRGIFLINTGRGALIDTRALIAGLKSGHIGAAGLDVYEEEEGVFFQDLSNRVLKDDVLARLLTFPNVLVTSHQAFFTGEALTGIAETTFRNISNFLKQGVLSNEVKIQTHFVPKTEGEVLTR